MRELIVVAASLVVLSSASWVSAQEKHEFGSGADLPPSAPTEADDEREAGYLGQLTLGFRSGYAIPLGKISRDGDETPLNEYYSGQIPAWIDIGYEPLPNLMLGGYGMWGPALIATCTAGSNCFGHVFRGGGQIHWLIAPRAQYNPWIGLGAAYEFAWFKENADGSKMKQLNRGPEIINIQLGLDIKPNNKLGIGPFASLSIGRYTHCKNTVDGSSGVRCDIEDRAQHEWLLIGARLYFSAIEVKKKGVDL